MYLFEKLIWTHRTQPISKRNQVDNEDGGFVSSSRLTFDPDAKEWGTRDPVDVVVTDADSTYGMNDTYLDVRAAFQEEKRGLITFGLLALVGTYTYLAFWQLGVEPAYSMLTSGVIPSGRPSTAGDVFFVAYVLAISAGIYYLIFRFAWPWVRVEIFTQRHLIARFNRKTRQVYLNRPSYAGGNVVLAWESAVAAIDPDDPDHLGMGGFLVLVFSNKRGPSDFEDVAFLGRPMRGNREIEGLWEYIRRYMEDGPEAIMKPKRLLPLWPSPVEAVRATLRFMSPMWRASGKPVALLTGLVLSPLLVLHALCHWISLLLCWKPRWPKEIREAGTPGKPIPKLTEIDDFGPELAERIRYNDRKDEEKAKPRRRRAKKAAIA